MRSIFITLNFVISDTLACLETQFVRRFCGSSTCATSAPQRSTLLTRAAPAPASATVLTASEFPQRVTGPCPVRPPPPPATRMTPACLHRRGCPHQIARSPGSYPRQQRRRCQGPCPRGIMGSRCCCRRRCCKAAGRISCRTSRS